MKIHICPRCHYETTKKSSIKNHYDRKRACKTLFSRKSIKDCLQELENDRLSISELKRRNKELEDEKRDFEIKKKEIEAMIEKRVSEKMKEEEKPEEKPVTNQYIYVLQEREFVRNNENVYKLGKTVNPKQRLSSYPKGSKVHMVMPCEDCSEAEKYLLDWFRELFVSRKDIGSEYFEGDLLMMTKTAMRYLLDTP